MRNINPKMLPRLDEIEDDLLTRRARAEHEAWRGEVEGIDLTPHLHVDTRTTRFSVGSCFAYVVRK